MQNLKSPAERLTVRGLLKHRLPSVAIIAIIAIAALLADQSSKLLILSEVMQPPRVIAITPFFNLTLRYNPGVSFGMFGEALRDWPEAMALLKLLISGGLLVWAMLTRSRLERAGLAMVVGGALGNAADRFRQGAVTDFLDFHWQGWHWPTFNVADIAIVAGAGLVLAASFQMPARRNAAP